MNHLIINRDYPPSPYRPGGIGTYVAHVSRLLANHGETVHVISQLWPGAARARESLMDGRLIVHRVPLDEPLPHTGAAEDTTLKAFRASALPVQAFMWQAARLTESLIESAAIDIIEAQEYEAPLYFLLLRRALGLATARRVPVIVHLHTGTEFVFEQNGWDQDRPDYLPAKRLEDYTIRAADALLCPSRFLARIVEQHYQLERGSIEVLPYPIGETAIVQRNADTWANGTICYIGRLEPRKGVVEWIEAAVAVAADNRALRFTLIGGDTPYSGAGGRSTREVLQSRIPPGLQPAFTFVDFVPREQLVAHLSRAKLAVVPSRWENFPNTCIEAMSSGLPVLVSPSGGMAEMVEDGLTGWIAEGSDPHSLEVAFRRALETPPEVLAQMGTAAAAAIGLLCDNEQTIRRHLEFRRRVVARGCHRSIQMVAPSGRAIRPERSAARPSTSTASGVAFVIRARREEVDTACLESIVAQVAPPAHVALIVRPEAKLRELSRLGGAVRTWQIVKHLDVGSDAAHNEALHGVAAACNPLAVAFLDDEWVLAPEYAAAVTSVFRHCSTMGIVTPWYREDGRIHTGLPPAYPYQWAWNDVGPCAAFRVVAIEDAGPIRMNLGDGDVLWELSNAILAAGWRAAPFPAALASLQVSLQSGRPRVAHAPALPPASGQTITPLDVLRLTPQERRELVRRALSDPAYVVTWLAWHFRRAFGRLPRRFFANGRLAMWGRSS